MVKNNARNRPIVSSERRRPPLGLLSTPESCRARTNMAVGPRLRGAAAGQCDTARRLQDAAVRSGQTKPAVARALPPSQIPVVGTALGNYLSLMEAAALDLSDEVLALWGVGKKMKKLPKRKQLPHQRQQLKERRRLQKKRWRQLPHQRHRLRERRRLLLPSLRTFSSSGVHSCRSASRRLLLHSPPSHGNFVVVVVIILKSQQKWSVILL